MIHYCCPCKFCHSNFLSFFASFPDCSSLIFLMHFLKSVVTIASPFTLKHSKKFFFEWGNEMHLRPVNIRLMRSAKTSWMPFGKKNKIRREKRLTFLVLLLTWTLINQRITYMSQKGQTVAASRIRVMFKGCIRVWKCV